MHACMYEKPELYADARVNQAVLSVRRATVVLDRVWIVCYPGDEGIIYHPPGKSAQEAWQNCSIFLGAFERAWTNQGLKKRGFRARKVCVVKEKK